MTQIDAALTTGLPCLDRMLTGLIPGDNVVWQVPTWRDYRPFVDAYCRSCLEDGHRLVYFRFAKHPPLLPDDQAGAQIHHLDPGAGFEQFVAAIHRVIEATGRGGYYLFDTLSDLAADWYSDQMLGNFFVLTCPYLYDVGAIAYFGVLKAIHAPEGVTTIADTAQVVIDVFRHRERLYLHPLKVQQRYSPTMNMLHEFTGTGLTPVVDSGTITEVMGSSPWSVWETAAPRRGLVNRAFAEAEHLLELGETAETQRIVLMPRLLRTIVSRDDRVLHLLERYLSLAEIARIRRRMIGTGLIGGKSVGMLLSRAILERTRPEMAERLEPHDSFFVGSDVYYTFLVKNGLWWVREHQRDKAAFLEGAERARQRILVGSFPDYIVQQFAAMLDYFGQSPIIIRSSSLLEDNFGNSFAGKYDSVFCANQGPRQERLEDLLAAVRTIFASTMSERALSYRAQRGLLERDEQMALLVQRVSGSFRGRLFHPDVAGVGLSYNPFAWSSYVQPEAGLVRMVFGLGTRAVDRCDDDYTRLVALNAPERRPEAHIDDVRRYTQKKVDVIDLDANQLLAHRSEEVLRRSPGTPSDLLLERVEGGGDPLLTFEGLLRRTGFVADMRCILATLAEAYAYPVDIEFTANLIGGTGYRINLVQCRPLQVKGGGAIVAPPTVAESQRHLEARGAVIGHSRIEQVARVIYVVPATYSQLSTSRRYSVARLIGRLVHLEGTAARNPLMLVGPGRWGTTTPAMGVPVSFSEINTVSVVCEVVAMHEGLVPDVSLGTHFFNELVEQDMLYLALFPGKDGNRLDTAFFESEPNRLVDLLPGSQNLAEVVRVIDLDPPLTLNANVLDQRVICYR